MTLAQWYTNEAIKWAEAAENLRLSRVGGAIRIAQHYCAVYARLAQQAAERYGEAQLNDYLESYADYQEYCFAMLRLGEAPETFVKWYNGANQANNPYVTQPQAVQP